MRKEFAENLDRLTDENSRMATELQNQVGYLLWIFKRISRILELFSGCCSQGRVPWEGLEPEGSQKWFWEKYQPAPWESADDHWEEGEGKMNHLICLFRIKSNLKFFNISAKELTYSHHAGNRRAARPARDGLGEDLTAGVNHNPAERRHGECRIWDKTNIYIYKYEQGDNIFNNIHRINIYNSIYNY